MAEALPAGVWESVMGGLDAPSLASCAATSREFRGHATSDLVWSRAYQVCRACTLASLQGAHRPVSPYNLAAALRPLRAACAATGSALANSR